MNRNKTLVELKAKIEDLKKAKEKVLRLNPKYAGRFHQIDTYFNVPQGRLKLREAKGAPYAQLIYYERENVAAPKESKVFILEIQNPEIFKEKTEKILGIKSVVEKIREIYLYKGTKIHLDEVKKLGFFIEFEKEVEVSKAKSAKEFLRKLMNKVGVDPENLMELSYGELIILKEKE